MKHESDIRFCLNVGSRRRRGDGRGEEAPADNLPALAVQAAVGISMTRRAAPPETRCPPPRLATPA
ncbi:hypothetical protein CBM2606_A110241 [Cupriavidus taiwanensis]|nr:hypothetical protein CBM2606_A110241 [Cupriavidus taiwanensis]